MNRLLGGVRCHPCGKRHRRAFRHVVGRGSYSIFLRVTNPTPSAQGTVEHNLVDKRVRVHVPISQVDVLYDTGRQQEEYRVEDDDATFLPFQEIPYQYN